MNFTHNFFLHNLTIIYKSIIGVFLIEKVDFLVVILYQLIQSFQISSFNKYSESPSSKLLFDIFFQFSHSALTSVSTNLIFLLVLLSEFISGKSATILIEFSL